MGHNNINLASLIGSRICHDLISPIGAINNGLELLSMEMAASGAEMDLIAQSVENASARIRFFRIAYGMAGEHLVGRAEVVSILKDYTAGGRLEIVWGPLEGHPRGDVRMAFLGIQCLENAMPYGGTIKIMAQSGRFQLLGEAEKLNIDDRLWSILDGGPSDEIIPSQVQFALLRAAAEESGRTLKVNTPQQMVSIEFET